MSGLIPPLCTWILLISLCKALQTTTSELIDGDRTVFSGEIILPENNGKLAGAQFVAEPDDLRDLENSLPLDIQRGMIKEFYQGKNAVLPNNDQIDLTEKQNAKVLKNALSKRRNSKRRPKKVTVNFDDILRFQNEPQKRYYATNMAFKGSKERPAENSHKQRHYYKGRRNHLKFTLKKRHIFKRRHGGLRNHIRTKAFQNEGSENYIVKKDYNHHSHSKHGKSFSNVWNSIENYIKRHKIYNLEKERSVKSSVHYILDSTKDDSRKRRIDELQHKLQKIADNFKTNGSVKRNNIERNGEIIKGASIFSDIAAAFEHIKQDEEATGAGNTKKSSLITAKEKDEDLKPVDGGFTPWTGWSECSETCGSNAIKMRMRVCTDPAPANGGKDCEGWRFEVKYCNIPHCEVNNTVEPTGTPPQQIDKSGANTNTSDSSIDSQREVKIDDKNVESSIAKDTILDKGLKTSINSVKGVGNTNGRSTNTHGKDSFTDKDIEKMFNEAVNAFKTSSKENHSTPKHRKLKRTRHKKKKKHFQKHFHGDSGLILSENEVDTFDDSLDKSKEKTKHNKGKENLSVKLTALNGQKTLEFNEPVKTDDADLLKAASEILKLKNADSVLKELENMNDSDLISLSDPSLNYHNSSSSSGSTVNSKNKTRIYEGQQRGSNRSTHNNPENLTYAIASNKDDSYHESNVNLTKGLIDDWDDKNGNITHGNDQTDSNDEQVSQENTMHNNKSSLMASNMPETSGNETDSGGTISTNKSQKSDPHNESNATKKSNDYNSINLHALNALAEILAEHYNQTKNKANSTNNNVTSSAVNITNKNEKSTNFTNDDFKVPKGNIMRSNNLPSAEAKNFDQNKISVDDIFETGIDMLRSYAVGEEKRVNVSSVQDDSKSGNESVIEGDKRHDVHHNESNNLPSVTETNTTESNISTISNDLKNALLDVNAQLNSSTIKPALKDTNATHNMTSSSQGKPAKKDQSLFEVLKEIVSTFTKLSKALNNQVPKNNNTVSHNSTIHSSNFTDDMGEPFSLWSSWSECSKRCGHGIKTRQRTCISNDVVCVGPVEENQPCDDSSECPVNGGFSAWSDWSPCAKSCGRKIFKIRSRTCSNPTASFGGEECVGTFKEKRRCELKPCNAFFIAGKVGNQTLAPQETALQSEKGLWAPWSAWSKCSKSCGGQGHEHRQRMCLQGKNCPGDLHYETRQCGVQICPVDGGYTEWSDWTSCTPSCGERAYKSRRRNCTNPRPQYGGKQCPYPALETMACAFIQCPVDGQFSFWSSWSPCDKSCGSTGTSHRKRECNSPMPMYGGKQCIGNNTDVRQCGRKPCPIDGKFTPWSGWTNCPTVCGGHFNQSRFRKCEDPKPQFGGKTCIGHLFEKRKCAQPSTCPVDGGLSEWTAWSACPKGCNEIASSHRQRFCNNPKPQNGGKACTGEIAETRPCAGLKCKVDGGFTTWSSWSSCSKECGHTSIRSRERFCTEPAPSNGGKPCKGPKIEISVCQADGCPRDGKYSAWSSWSECPSCGEGLSKRLRTCTNPPPLNGGKACNGSSEEVKPCPKVKCQDEKALKQECSYNLCNITKCLGHPNAECSMSSNCKPMFFDKRGNSLRSCIGDSIVVTSSPEMVCENDPCKISGCYSNDPDKCYVTLDCSPVFVDSNDQNLQCRGLLKVPPRTVCQSDPCKGDDICEKEPSAQCILDFKCDPVFVSQENEIVDNCTVTQTLTNSTKANANDRKKAQKAKTLKMILQTTEDIKKMKNQLQELLNNNDEGNTENNYNPKENTENNFDPLAAELENERKALKQFNTDEQNTIKELTADGANPMNDPASSLYIMKNKAAYTNRFKDPSNSFNGDSSVNALAANGEVNEIADDQEGTMAPIPGNSAVTVNSFTDNGRNNQALSSYGNPLEYRLQQFRKRNKFYKPGNQKT